MTDDPVYLSTKEAARLVGLHPDYLKQLRAKGGGPPFYQGHPRAWVKYAKTEVIAWMEAKRHLAACEHW